MKLNRKCLALAVVIAVGASVAPANPNGQKPAQKVMPLAIDQSINDQISKAMLQVNAAVAGLQVMKDIDIPDFDTTVPAQHVDVRSITIRVPAIHIHIPAIHTSKNGRKVDVAPINVDVPEIKVEVPAIHVDVPAIHVHVPKTHIHVKDNPNT